MKRHLTLLIILFGSFAALGDDQPEEWQSHLATAQGAERTELLADLTDHYRKSSPDKAIAYGEEALVLLKEFPNVKMEIEVRLDISIAYRYLGLYESALDQAKRAQQSAEEAGDLDLLAEALNSLGYTYYRLGDSKIARDILDRALALNEKLKNEKRIAQSLQNLGNVSYSRAEFSEALEYYSRALSIREDIRDMPGIADTLTGYGQIYREMGDYSKAIDYHFQALHIRKETGNPRDIANSLNSIGTVNRNLEKYENAQQYHLQAMRIHEEIGDRFGISYSLNGLGIVFRRLGDYDKALEYYYKALELRKETGDRRRIANTLTNIGVVYRDMREYDKALEYYLQALSIKEEIGNRQGIARAILYVGEIETLLGRHAEALDYLEQSLNLAQDIGTKEIIRDSYKGLADTYEAMGNLEKALGYFKKYNIADEELIGAETHKEVARLQVRLGLLEKEQEISLHKQEIELLQRDSQLQQAKLEKQTFQRNFFLGGAALLLLLVLVITRFYLLKRQSEIRYRKADELKTQLLSVVCHDLRSPLGAVIGLAEEIKEELDDSASDAARMADLISNSGNQIMDLAKNLLDFSALELGKLVLEMETVDVAELTATVVEEFHTEAARKNQRVVVSIADEGGCSLIADKSSMRRILENLLSNAIKYSPPDSTINLKVEKRDKMRIEVRDEGPGFTEDDKTRLFGELQRLSAQPTGGESSIGLGLSIVRRLVELHKGRVWLESGIGGKGSTFIVELPV